MEESRVEWNRNYSHCRHLCVSWGSEEAVVTPLLQVVALQGVLGTAAGAGLHVSEERAARFWSGSGRGALVWASRETEREICPAVASWSKRKLCMIYGEGM